MKYQLEVKNGRAILTDKFRRKLIDFLQCRNSFKFSIIAFTVNDHTIYFMPQHYTLSKYNNGLISDSCKPLKFYITTDNNTYQYVIRPFFIVDNIHHYKDMSLDLYNDYYNLPAQIIITIE